MSFLWGFVNSQPHASKQQERRACLLRTQARKLRRNAQARNLRRRCRNDAPEETDRSRCGRRRHREWLEGLGMEQLDGVVIKDGSHLAGGLGIMQPLTRR